MTDMTRIRKFKEHRRQMRVRKKVVGTPDRPRLSVYRSARNIYAQIIDDLNGTTLLSCSSVDKDMAAAVKKAEKKTDMSLLIGETIAKKASEKGIKSVVFDRNRYQYHGRVKAVAEGARKGGLEF